MALAARATDEFGRVNTTDLSEGQGWPLETGVGSRGIGPADLAGSHDRLRLMEGGGTIQGAIPVRRTVPGILVAAAEQTDSDDDGLPPELSFGQALVLDFAYAADTRNLTLGVLNRVAELGDEDRVVSYLEGETLALYEFDRHKLGIQLARYSGDMTQRQKAICLVFLLVESNIDLRAVSAVIDRHVTMVDQLRLVQPERSVSLGEAVVLQFGPWLSHDAQGNPVPTFAGLQTDLAGKSPEEVARYFEAKAAEFASYDQPGRGSWGMSGAEKDAASRVVSSIRRIMVASGYPFVDKTSTSAASEAILARLTGRLSRVSDDAAGVASYAHFQGSGRRPRRPESPPVEGGEGVRPAEPAEESQEVAELLDEITPDTTGADWALIEKARRGEPLSAGEAVYLYLYPLLSSGGEMLLHLHSVRSLERMDQVLAYLQSELLKVYRQDRGAVDSLLAPFGTSEEKVVAYFLLLKGGNDDGLENFKGWISAQAKNLGCLRGDLVGRSLSDVVFNYIGYELQENDSSGEFSDLDSELSLLEAGGTNDERVADYFVGKAARILGVETSVLEEAMVLSRGRMSPAERAIYSIYLVLNSTSDPRTRSDLSISLQSAIVERLTGQVFQSPVVDRDEIEALAARVQAGGGSGPRTIEDLYREIGFDVVARERAHKAGTFIEHLRIYLALAAERNAEHYEDLALELRVLDEFLKTRFWEFPDRQRLCLDFVRAYMGQGNGGKTLAEKGLSAPAFLEQRWREGEEKRRITETLRNAVREVERRERERMREERERRRETRRG